MTLQDLRYVVALADQRHFGRAAEACDVSQPTLSAQIRKLEERLGVVLFERTNKSVSPTAIGAEIAGRARQVLTDVDAILAVGRRAAGPLAGTFSLGVIPTLGPYLLPWLVPALRDDYPELRLSIREDLTASLLERLGLYRLDAVLVALPVADERFRSLALFDEPFWLAEPPGDGSARGRTVSEGELSGRSLLLLTEGHCLRDQALALCGTADRDAAGDFRATSLETILQMVSAGMGSTLLPAMARGPSGRAVSLSPLQAGVGRRIGLVHRQSDKRGRDLDLLADTIRRHLPDGVHPVR